jgi:D-arginine dehydrogenase
VQFDPRRTSHDFIVIGAGIAGASVAYELSRAARVCVIEGEGRPGMHATGRSAALFAPSYGGREIRALTRASRAFFDAPPSGFSAHALLKHRGCLYIARADQRERLRQMVAAIHASGGHVAHVSASEARARVPLLRPDYLAAAAFDSDATDIDVNALHEGFLRAARLSGSRIITGVWAREIHREQGVWALDLAGERLSAPVLINSAGAWADEVASACGARPVGLKPLRRTALVVDPPSDVDVSGWPAVIDADEQFYFKPEAGKLLLSPADETPDRPGDAHPQDLDVAVGVDRVEAALAIEVRRVAHSWAGLRTFSADRVPVLGFDPEVPGFFWCAGQGGYGIQSSPAMARAAAALVRNEPLPPDVAAEGLAAADLSPARFAAGMVKKSGNG